MEFAGIHANNEHISAKLLSFFVKVEITINY
jgi:hypothetical protein